MTAIELDGKDMLVRPDRYPTPEIKEVLGGRWDKEKKAWRVVPTSFAVSRLVKWYGHDEMLDGAPYDIRALLAEEWGFERWDDFEYEDAAQHSSWDRLYDFQREAVEYAACNPHRCALVGLSPGLGKTPVTTVLMDIVDAERVLVLSPLSLTLNWEREIDTWSDRVREVKRATALDKTPGPEVTITNFETVMEAVHRDEQGRIVEAVSLTETAPDDTMLWESCTPEYEQANTGPKAFKEWRDQGPKKVDPKTGKTVNARERIVQARRDYVQDWDLVVIDESILFKNRKAKKVDVVSQIAKGAERIVLLSGSATAKFRDDLYAQLNLLMPRAFRSYWRFAEEYCFVEKGQWGWTIEGDRPGVDLHEDLKDYLFVRDQKDVLAELPDYIERPITVELTKAQQKAHDSLIDEWLVELEDGTIVDTPNILAQMTRLQQVTSHMANFEAKGSAKEDALAQMIENGDVEFPLLVWVNYVPTGKAYESRLRELGLDVAFVHGGASSNAQRTQREATLDAFKAGDLDVLVLQFEVGKFGHTFTNTHTVFYADRSFNSDSIVQSLRRVKRIGLDHSPVLIVPRAPGTVDEIVEANLEGKLRSIASVSRADLIELLRSLGR